MINFNSIIETIGEQAKYEVGDVVRKVVAKPNNLYHIYYNGDGSSAAKICTVTLAFNWLDEEQTFELSSFNVISVTRTLVPFNSLGLLI